MRTTRAASTKSNDAFGAAASSFAVAASALLVAVAGCWHPKREAVPRVAHLAYPDCGHGPLDFALAAETLVERDLWTRRELAATQAVEHYAIVRRECLTIGTARIERAFDMVDVEVIWDAHGKPLRAWKRVTAPGAEDRPDPGDITLYELRTHDVTITHRSTSGIRDYARVRGAAPTAVITESKGLLAPWIERAHLAVGQRTHARALDTTLPATVEDEAMLVRKDDLDRADVGGRVQVYAVYGRDTVFTDADAHAVGDLSGLRVAEPGTPRPFPAQPLYGGPDPVGTP